MRFLSFLFFFNFIFFPKYDPTTLVFPTFLHTYGVRRATFHDLAVPEPMRPLLDYLLRRAGPRPLP